MKPFLLLTTLFSTCNLFLFAQSSGRIDTAASNDSGIFGDALVFILLGTSVILFAVIIALGKSLLGLLQVSSERKTRTKINSLALMLLMVPSSTPPETFWLEEFFKLPAHIHILLLVIAFELVIIATFYYQIRLTLNELFPRSSPDEEAVSVKRSFWTTFYERWNRAFPRGKEVVVGDHDYDGIKELDNPVPPWWTVAFMSSILFGLVYITRYHVLDMSPLQAQELTIAQEEAAKAIAKYRATAAANVDENTVKMGDALAIENGRSLYKVHCVACHGPDGQGGVGPNMSDRYFLHGGDIQSIFKVIKYGVAEKGMKSWKEDFSPTQIAQLASFVKSLIGSNPPNQKEKQGELYAEVVASASGVAADTLAVATPDSTGTTSK